ncbi:MAG: peptidoglycan DD-metalloendopeptidase family protein [Archangium sp.]
MKISNFAVVLFFAACGPDAVLKEFDGPLPDEKATVASGVSCDPQMNRFPVAAPHNIGYDGASCGSGTCDITCPDANANSDYGGPHHGNDVFAFYRAPIVAVVTGTVQRVGWPSSTSGLRVTISDGCGWWYYYGHLDEAVVSEGQRVEAGQLIGFMGHSGAPSTHLHFNVSRDGDYDNDIDPFGLLAATSGTSCQAAPPPPAPDVPFYFAGGHGRVGKNADGRLELFCRGADRALWNQWQPAPSKGPWSGWNPLGGGLSSDPVVAANSDGRLEVFVVGFDGALWHKWQWAPGGSWSDFFPEGGQLSSEPAVGRNKDGRLEVFARGVDGALWHKWQNAPNSDWSGWDSLGGSITSVPVVVNNSLGTLEVYARGADGALWRRRQGPFGWTDWESLHGNILFAPAIELNADGRLEIFVWGSDRALWHAWETTPAGSVTGFVSLGGVLTSRPEVARNADGRLEVFVRGGDNAAWHIWQLTPGGGWSSWASEKGNLSSGIHAGINSLGGIELFARGSDNQAWIKWQTPFGWSDWAPLGGSLYGW